MQYLKRKIICEEKQTLEAFRYQAAINSDGCLTLRGLQSAGVGDEESTLLVFNRRETEAIFELIKVLKHMPDGLPF